jgi:serine/threonine protein kinase
MLKPTRVGERGRVLDGKYELAELIEFMGDRDHTSLWRGVVHGAAAFTRDVAIRRLPLSLRARYAALDGAALEHANIVRVYDVCGDVVNNLYLVMEWIDGISLGELARGAHHLGLRVPWQLIGCIGVGALHGLAAGHAAESVHGHLSWRSLLIDRRGVVHLTPFGLAEHDALSSRTVDKDLRDLAITLWDALASTPTLDAVADVPPSPVRAVLEYALEIGYESADEMAQALAATLVDVPWQHGPQTDTGAAVNEAMNALAWSPTEPYSVDAMPGEPVVLVHLAPRLLDAAQDLASLFDLSDTGEWEPYESYELRKR